MRRDSWHLLHLIAWPLLSIVRCLRQDCVAALTKISYATRRRPQRRSSGCQERGGRLLRWWLVLHAGIFQRVRPLAARPRMAMFQMLSEVIGAEELPGHITLSKLVLVVQVLCADVPLWGIREFFATVPAHIRRIRAGAVERRIHARQWGT